MKESVTLIQGSFTYSRIKKMLFSILPSNDQFKNISLFNSFEKDPKYRHSIQNKRNSSCRCE